MSTITTSQENAIREYLEGKHIPAGIGTEGGACSIAAINLALSGKLTDNIPDCMSLVVGTWIIRIQDEMPDDMRNSADWRNLLPVAAGTGREHEGERVQVVLEWMWETVLPYLQVLADDHGFGEKWKAMTTEKTIAAAEAASEAASESVSASEAASYAASEAASYAAAAAGDDDASAAYCAAASTACADDDDATAWDVFAPASLLKKLIEVGTD